MPDGSWWTFKKWTLVWLGLVTILAITRHPGWAFFCLILWCSWPAIKRQERADASERSVRSDFIFKDADGTKWTFDMESQKIAVRKGSKVRLFEKADILSVDVEKNGSSIQTIKKGGSIAGALVGGLVGGGLGAVVGYTGTGTSTAVTEERISELALRLTVNDPHAPLLKMSFLSKKVGVPVASREVVLALQNMEVWRARFAILLR